MKWHPWRNVALSFAAALALSAPAVAQCPIPDGLDGGPCCATTQLVLPPFPAMTQSALEICWRDCNIDAQVPYQACWAAPTQAALPAGPLCSVFLSRLDLKNAAGAVLWGSGPMRLFYSRTWVEVANPVTTYQVWRFLVNGDLRPTAVTEGKI